MMISWPLMGYWYSDVASLIEIMTIMGAKIERKEDSLSLIHVGWSIMPMPFGASPSARASYYFYGSLLDAMVKQLLDFLVGADLAHVRSICIWRPWSDGALWPWMALVWNPATDGKPLQGANIYMGGYCYVGATINTILAAVKAEGRTVIARGAGNLKLSMWWPCSTT